MRLALAAACFAAAVLAAAPARADKDKDKELPRSEMANTGTAKVDFKDGEWVKVGLDVHGVRVERLILHAPRGMNALMIRHDEANRVKLTVLNDTDVNIEPSIAIAVFDAEGRLLAAGNTGLSIRTLKARAYRDVEVHLGGVYRHLDTAATVYVTLEY